VVNRLKTPNFLIPITASSSGPKKASSVRKMRRVSAVNGKEASLTTENQGMGSARRASENGHNMANPSPWL
jgi:hypothetical protein